MGQLQMAEVLGQGAFGQVKRAVLTLPAKAASVLGKQGLGPMFGTSDKTTEMNVAVKMLHGGSSILSLVECSM